MKTYIVIPTYNEANNVEPMIAALCDQPLPDTTILIVDDDSPDGTAAIVEGIIRERPGQVELIKRPDKMGLGTAYKDGFRRALDRGAEAIVQMDADFSHSPDYLPRMLKLLDDYDVVIGSRYVEGGSLDEGWGVNRRLLSWWANAYTRFILGMETKDTTAGFKVWRRDTLIGIDLARIHSNGYDFQVEMSYVTEKLGYRAVEIPIHFEDRRIGQSKMDVPVKIEAALRVWDVLWRHRHLTPAMRAPYTVIPSENDSKKAQNAPEQISHRPRR